MGTKKKNLVSKKAASRLHDYDNAVNIYGRFFRTLYSIKLFPQLFPPTDTNRNKNREIFYVIWVVKIFAFFQTFNPAKKLYLGMFV